ncbi:MAG: ATP-binding protein [Candidatus Moraniibacteriota bacterium]
MNNLLEKIYTSNPWFENEQLIEKDLHLKELAESKQIFLDRKFLDHKFADGVYIATGPRQIGKTTHLKLLIQQKIIASNKTTFLYFNCDLLETKAEVVELVETYLKNFPTRKRVFVMLDEITSVKDSILGIKYLIDKGVKKNITYILTGSSTVEIKKTGEFLPGRRGKGIDFYFAPVSFRDFVKIQYSEVDFDLRAKESLEKYYVRIKNKIPLTSLLDSYFFCGGIPRIINEYLKKKTIGLENLNLYRDWIVSEIAKNGKRENVAKQIVARIILSITSDVSYNSFAQDAGLGSHNTVYEYLNFLEDAFVVSQIYNYDYHQKKINFRKNKKIYLNDPFLFFLFDWWLNGRTPSIELLSGDPILKSRIAENLTFLHLRKIFKEVYFNRDSEEIDFICGEIAFETKFQNKISTEDFKGLLRFVGKKIVVSKNILEKRGEVRLLPLELFLLLDGIPEKWSVLP